MQIIALIVVLVLFISFIIYKINNRFKLKEFTILGIVLLVSILTVVMLVRNEEEKIPNLFKQKYEKEKNITILKFAYERINNITLSTDKEFIYNFDYIIAKNNQRFLCSAKNIKIKKIQDQYVFENFYNFKEECEKE